VLSGKPYHRCWHFVVFAVVVFAAFLAPGGARRLQSLPAGRQGRLGGLKVARGRRCADCITLFIRI